MLWSEKRESGESFLFLLSFSFDNVFVIWWFFHHFKYFPFDKIFAILYWNRPAPTPSNNHSLIVNDFDSFLSDISFCLFQIILLEDSNQVARYSIILISVFHIIWLQDSNDSCKIVNIFICYFQIFVLEENNLVARKQPKWSQFRYEKKTFPTIYLSAIE